MTEIVQWAAYRHGGVMCVYDLKEEAENDIKHHGGTVVKLTGKMPRQPIERKTTAWVQTSKPFLDSKHAFDRLGIVAIAEGETDKCQTKVEIIVREVQE